MPCSALLREETTIYLMPRDSSVCRVSVAVTCSTRRDPNGHQSEVSGSSKVTKPGTAASGGSCATSGAKPLAQAA